MAIRYWLSVAPRDRVLREVEAGIVHAYFDARAVLAQANESDGIVRYSPRGTTDGEALRHFTGIGWIADATLMPPAGGAPAPVTAGVTGNKPLRRRVDYSTNALAVPIHPMLHALELTSRNRHWGYQLRGGVIELSKHDFIVIREQMRPPAS